MRLTLTNTACKRAHQHGLDADAIMDIFNTASTIKPSEQRDGQYVVSKGDFNIVGVYVGDDRFHGITIFKNRGEK